MKNYHVYVISKKGRRLMPTRRFGKVRRLLKSGLAKAIKRKPFTIQLLYETREYTQPLVLGIDPGSGHIGGTVRTQTGEIIYAAELTTRTGEVPGKMSERQMHRRSRRRHRREKRQRRAKKAKTCFESKKFEISGTKEELVCKFIKPKAVRFNNRVRKEGWLTPTANHLLESHKNFVESIAKILPITEVCVEYGKFDIQKLENTEIEGKEYQNGRKKGYANSSQYVLCRDKHTCKLCEKTGVVLHAHHVIWRRNGGQDLPENMITLCSKCHEKVHKRPKIDEKVKKIFKGIEKSYVHTTLLNIIMPYFYQWLLTRFAQVSKTYGYETKEKRREFGLPKHHYIDAYLTTLNSVSDKVEIEDIVVYEFVQFRRHHRQIIHAVRDRNYKEVKKIVAKNRKKRTGQLTDSVAEVIEKKGRQYLHSLRVLPGKKVKRSNFSDFRKGDVVRYNGRIFVVKGYGEMGRSLGFINEKKYVPAKYCQLVIRNTGLVCL